MYTINEIIGQINKKIIGTSFKQILNNLFKIYKSRVEADSGTVQDEDISLTIFQMLTDNDLYDGTKLLITPEGGITTRVDGVNVYVPKAYDFSANDNDATQTTAASQPHLSGNIAPNEFKCLKNVNGGSRYFTHPEISFASDEAWIVSIVFNFSGTTEDSNLGSIFAHSGASQFRTQLTRFLLVNASGAALAIGAFDSLYDIIGKNTILQLVADGAGSVTLFINGQQSGASISISSNVFISRIFQSAFSAKGTILIYHIYGGSVTPTQITAEYTALRALVPEIESVTIGTQTWATSNLEMVATPLGNVIQEMQDASSTEKVTGGDFEGFADTAEMVAAFPMANDDETATWTLNATNPISGSQDGLLDVTSAGTSTTYPRVTDTAAAVVSGKWYKDTFDYKVNSGTCVLSQIFGFSALNETLSGSGTFTIYHQCTTSYPKIMLMFNGTNTFQVQIDNISREELGWADSQDLYDAVYYQEAEADSAVELITNAADREFSSDTGFWTKQTGWSIGSGVASASSATGWIYKNGNDIKSGSWCKITYTVKNYTSGAVQCGLGAVIGTERTANGTYTEYLLAASDTFFGIRGVSTNAFTGDIDDVSFQELGLTANEADYEQAALEAAAMWCHYNNDTDNGAIYGKLYNWFAAKLLQTDIDTYNASNPDWGWHVPTQAEFSTLQTYLGGSTVAGGKMKVTGTDYWNTPNTGADNSSGFSALPNGYRTNVFGKIGISLRLWTSTSSNSTTARVLRAEYNSAATNSNYGSKDTGYALRLIQD